ncbi:tRNA pseudouridine(55) synthase TruB [Candidatus Woesebacteria bacterium]|nr:tRNA pseudouridine(55) synthase TruB [Candidatus Woesebacteria bacterium]
MFLLIDKPKGITSHDVIDKVRKVTGEKKVGHAGTLDPNATGLLIVGVERKATKKLGEIAKNTKKTYEAEIFLGEERDTDDAEGVVISKAKGFLPPGENEIEKILISFEGEQTQIPPIYSALKIKGKKAYELARKGKKVNLKPRKVVIYSIKLVSYKFPILEIETTVSSGTYIRALARDIGKKLSCGAYLRNLRRTKIGKFDIKDAVKLENLDRGNWKNFVI